MAEESTEQAGEVNQGSQSERAALTAQEQAREQEKPIEQIRQLKLRVEQLEKELAQEREKATDYMNQALRAQADMSNMRKRLQQDINRMLAETLKQVVYQQLAVLDSFERAFQALPEEFEHFTWVEGVGLIHNQLFNILLQTGVTPIEARGKKFNPIEHEAVAYEETEAYPEDTVTAELQRGYKLNDQVLRPALVKIARKPQPVASGTDSSGTEEAAQNSDNTSD
ncbi:MAG TPA: nucleotide exchange factor GrpE [Ktedonobacteraceae bacterium]|nr:nucleotide exchange factor GrpE [Ktedonobacteraceae bacterium]